MESEKGLLGSMLIAPAEVCATVEDLSAAHFYLPAHQAIWQLLCDAWHRQKPLDLILLTQTLRDLGQLDAVGGPAFVTELYTYVPTAANARFYADTVREKALLRAIITRCSEARNLAYESGADAFAVMAAAGVTMSEVTPAPASQRTGSLPNIEDFSDLLSASIDEPPEVVVDLLHLGAKMVLGGGSKSFKTWLLTDLAISVATGSDWLGFPTQAGRVLFINLEIQRGFFRSRGKVIAEAKGVTVPSGSLDTWNLRGYAADISSIAPAILQKAGHQKYCLIVIDPIYKVMGSRDENKAGDIGGLLNELERLAVQSGAAVVFGAHFSKGNQASKESIDRIGGSGVYARDPDTILVLTRHEQDEAFSVESTLRNHPPVPPFVVRWAFPLMQRDDQLDPTKLKQVNGRPKAHAADELLDLLGDKDLSPAAWQALALKESGIKETTFHRLRRELMAAGKVRKSPVNGLWQKA